MTGFAKIKTTEFIKQKKPKILQELGLTYPTIINSANVCKNIVNINYSKMQIFPILFSITQPQIYLESTRAQSSSLRSLLP